MATWRDVHDILYECRMLVDGRGQRAIEEGIFEADASAGSPHPDLDRSGKDQPAEEDGFKGQPDCWEQCFAAGPLEFDVTAGDADAPEECMSNAVQEFGAAGSAASGDAAAGLPDLDLDLEQEELAVVEEFLSRLDAEAPPRRSRAFGRCAAWLAVLGLWCLAFVWMSEVGQFSAVFELTGEVPDVLRQEVAPVVAQRAFDDLEDVAKLAEAPGFLENFVEVPEVVRRGGDDQQAKQGPGGTTVRPGTIGGRPGLVEIPFVQVPLEAVQAWCKCRSSRYHWRPSRPGGTTVRPGTIGGRPGLVQMPFVQAPLEAVQAWWNYGSSRYHRRPSRPGGNTVRPGTIGGQPCGPRPRGPWPGGRGRLRG